MPSGISGSFGPSTTLQAITTGDIVTTVTVTDYIVPSVICPTSSFPTTLISTRPYTRSTFTETESLCTSGSVRILCSVTTSESLASNQQTVSSISRSPTPSSLTSSSKSPSHWPHWLIAIFTLTAQSMDNRAVMIIIQHLQWKSSQSLVHYFIYFLSYINCIITH